MTLSVCMEGKKYFGLILFFDHPLFDMFLSSQLELKPSPLYGALVGASNLSRSIGGKFIELSLCQFSPLSGTLILN